MWKGFHTRKIIGPKLSDFVRACKYLTTFLKGKIDRTRLRIKKNHAAIMLQKYMKRYLVHKTIRFV